MDPLAAARLIAAGRAAIGAALIVAPGRIGGGWVGGPGRSSGGEVLGRALGVRDLVLGALTLHVADKPGPGARMVAACAACDAVDLWATLKAGRDLPPTGRYGTAAIAGVSTVAGFALAAQLSRTQG